MNNIIKLIVFSLILLFGEENVSACVSVPVPASCTPNTLTYCCGFGITNVTFNTINNSTNDAVDGYTDSTCVQTTVLQGQTYLLSIQTSASSTQNYAAWIDFNNDGILNDVTERIFTASSQMNTSGNITIPAGATLNTPLRLRVSSDYDFSSAPSSCADLDFGQAEDYTVIINSNPNPPVPIFIASPTVTCDGVVCFTDQSLNIPTGWLWNFGDGNTSFQQNPCHTYTVDGVYTVILTATNANGGNVDSIVNYITVNSAGQVLAAACYPATSAYCCGYGITQVDFNTISNLTLDGIEGYQDFSCTHSTTITEGNSYGLTVTTGVSNPQDTRVWIDFNNDGSFNNTNELIMDIQSTFNPTLNMIIPGGGVLNTPLRMRVTSDVVGVAQSHCDANDFGQTEDYGVVILSNTLPPVSSFTANTTTTCSDSICFTDLSNGTPTGWLWNFGDGNTSSLQNPCHYYSTPGFYTVSLVTTNSFGTDSVWITNYINIDCSNIDMPNNGTNTYSACSGSLRDNGGNGNYSNNTDGVVVLQPPGATQVNLIFLFFDFVASNPGDTLFIYDGPSIFSPLIAFYTGNATPSSINSSGGSLTIRQKTDNFATDPGFELFWSCTVGIAENEKYADNIIIYPNPASELIKIKSKTGQELDIEALNLYNSVGQLVYQQYVRNNNSLAEIDISSLPKGLYFLNISSNKGVITKKINIQ
jgi:PKD repeat protein